MLLTLNLVVGVLIFETLMQAFVRRLDSQLVGRTPASDTPKLPDVVARCIRVAVLIGVAVTIAESWVVQVFALGERERMGSDHPFVAHRRHHAVPGLRAVGAVQVRAPIPTWSARPRVRPRRSSTAMPPASPASRISTLMPLMRGVVAIVIGLIAVMIALDDFGVNITPLIAGASVFGIAISFGSQTLVRDIVSGIFYLTDDAFRVGEYIDCGRAKGTVEGFTLRSIKLRHQNGQVHTIPFGQLGQITNFSRDWITVKFNLRFARDTDIEKLRKAAKKIGADMMEIPAIKDEILAPFKMQGVADITDNALLMRFKFTARPGNPAAIQREAHEAHVQHLPRARHRVRQGRRGGRLAGAVCVAGRGRRQRHPRPRPKPRARRHWRRQAEPVRYAGGSHKPWEKPHDHRHRELQAAGRHRRQEGAPSCSRARRPSTAA